MQSITVYGRMVVRAFLAEIGGSGELPALAWVRHSSSASQQALRRPVHLVSASAGISKLHSTRSSAARVGRFADGAMSASAFVEERTFGDDAFFMARHRAGDALGVADGVGGWRTYGVDPSLFSTSLMAVCERMVREGRFSPKNPTELLASSYAEVKQSKSPLIGSCTACLVALHREDNMLYTTNLGDSGFILVRDGKVIHRSEEQQHYFNTPYQLAVAPAKMEGLVLSDRPESAVTSTCKVEEGDLILLGTDGLFDNMTDEQILRHLSQLQGHSGRDAIQRVANSIAEEAHSLGLDTNYKSPFSVNAAANGLHVTGGKPDDVTVLIARVTAGAGDFSAVVFTDE